MRAEQRELTKRLRMFQRTAEDSRKASDLKMQDLLAKVQLQRERVASLPTSETADLSPSHAMYKAAERSRTELKELERRVDDLRDFASEQAGELDAVILDLEFAIRDIDEAIDSAAARSDLEADFEQAQRDMAIAKRQAESIPVSVVPQAKEGPTVVQDDYRAARATAAAQGRPILVNFTAHTCIVCRQMEVSVFPQPAVAQHMNSVIEARLHADTSDVELRADIERRIDGIAKTFAQPVYVLMDPRTGQELARFEGASRTPEDFAKFLAAGLERFEKDPAPATSEELWRRIFDLEDEVQALRADVAAK